MMGTREQFEYFICDKCGSLHIADVPVNLGNYYPKDYYSFRKIEYTPMKSLLRVLRFHFIVKCFYRGWPAFYLQFLRSIGVNETAVESIGKLKTQKSISVLDIGAGNGYLLQDLKNLGFTNLIGVDRYIDASFVSNGLRILKSDVFGLSPDLKFDLIIYNHSLEHVQNPCADVIEACGHLKENGVIMISIPIVAYAFRIYGKSWFQLDAPRHLNIPSLEGLFAFAHKIGLSVTGYYFNSGPSQLLISEQYAKNIPFSDRDHFSIVALFKKFVSSSYHDSVRIASILNEKNSGDSAVFYLKKTPAYDPGKS